MVSLEEVQKHEYNEGFYVPGVEDIRSERLTTLGNTHREIIARADLTVIPQTLALTPTPHPEREMGF